MTASDDLRHYLVTQCPLFRGLTPAEAADVAALSKGESAEPRALLFKEGEPATKFFLIYVGRVKLFRTESGAESIIRLLGPGQYCGWLGLAVTQGYPASARALENTEALSWSQLELNDLFARFKALPRNALRIQARWLREREERYRELATQRVAERLARTLLRLAQPLGRRFDDCWVGELHLSRADVAALVGTTIFSVSRLLSQWDTDGHIRSGRESIWVDDPEKLAAIARQAAQNRLAKN